MNKAKAPKNKQTQERKYMLSLAGEFLVAGELLRRNLNAAVTYGNAKKADVVAVSGRIACSIEVKTTQQPKWVVGNKPPEADNAIWVLVYLPNKDSDAAEFFILTGAELYAVLKSQAEKWRRDCMNKHGRLVPGVFGVKRQQIKNQKGKWHKIAATMKAI